MIRSWSVSREVIRARGFLAAYDVSSGQQKWRFETIPVPGEFGHETWQNDEWKTGGGPTWNTGSYDPVTDLLYWGLAIRPKFCR